MKHSVGVCVARTLALYGFAGWVYIALAALIRPETLGLQLTHFATFPHEDTFGAICFVVSFVSYFIYGLLSSRMDRRPYGAGPSVAGRGRSKDE